MNEIFCAFSALFNSNIVLILIEKDKKEDFLYYLNEFVNFDELKQSFAMFMRFYAYNPHVYSDSLIKTLIICNQHFLNTYKNVHELMRQVQTHEHERFMMSNAENNGGGAGIDGENYELVNLSDTNATKNSSTVDSFRTDSMALVKSNVKNIYELYANTDTSFILKKVLATFEHNDPVLNRSCIDFLDGLMIECNKHEKLFHMSLALSLANITLLESFRFLDQRIKDLISSILVEIRCMCKRKPRLANKILFDVQNGASSSSHKQQQHQQQQQQQQKQMQIDAKRKQQHIDEISTSNNKRIKIGMSYLFLFRFFNFD